jgi:hypothetical protein
MAYLFVQLLKDVGGCHGLDVQGTSAGLLAGGSVGGPIVSTIPEHESLTIQASPFRKKNTLQHFSLVSYKYFPCILDKFQLSG